MPTAIVVLLLIGAVALLVVSWRSDRRDRDPASSIDSFQRAMQAMSHDDHARDSRRAPPT